MCLHAHHLVSFVPYPRLVIRGKLEGSNRAQIFRISSHQLTIGAIVYNGL